MSYIWYFDNKNHETFEINKFVKQNNIILSVIIYVLDVY